MKNILRSVAWLVLAQVASAAHAQNLQPGLWEISSTMQSGSGGMEKAMAELQKQMAAMSPEQRKMMQDTMAKQGMVMGGSGPGSMDIKVCMTKEMVERNEVASMEGDCKSSNSARSGNSMKVTFVCTKPASSGEGQVTFTSAQAYSARMTVNTSRNGKNETITMDGQGKWLSAECGAVKPITSSKK